MKSGRRPKLDADEKTVATIRQLARIDCTEAEAAAVLGVCRTTLWSFFKANPEVKEVWDDGLQEGRASLRRTLFKHSESNVGAAIFLAKNVLGYTDRHEVLSEIRDGRDIDSLTPEQLDERIMELQQRLARRNATPALIEAKKVKPNG